jgi:hypothetical protein
MPALVWLYLTALFGIGEEPLETLSEVLKSLEVGFRRQNQLDDANGAYYHMQLVELREAREDLGFRQRLPLEAQWVFWGYGELDPGVHRVVRPDLLDHRGPPEAMHSGDHRRFHLQIGKRGLGWIVALEWALRFYLTNRVGRGHVWATPPAELRRGYRRSAC